MRELTENEVLNVSAGNDLKTAAVILGLAAVSLASLTGFIAAVTTVCQNSDSDEAHTNLCKKTLTIAGSLFAAVLGVAVPVSGIILRRMVDRHYIQGISG